MIYCQSCGMPMEKESEFFGTNADGSKNEEYCSYCFKDGKFTADVTMDEMVEICVPPVAANVEGMTEDGARKMMREFLPTLKRWK